jgi:hypothetical protein
MLKTEHVEICSLTAFSGTDLVSTRQRVKLVNGKADGTNYPSGTYLEEVTTHGKSPSPHERCVSSRLLLVSLPIFGEG